MTPTRFLILCAGLAAFSARSLAVAATLCPPYALAGGTTLDATAPFLPFMLAVGDRPAGAGRDVYLTGDELFVTRANLGNLIKRANAIDPTLRSLTLDARRIVVQDSLAFDDAEIRLVAEEVELRNGGVFTLVPSPGKPIQIFADRVVLPDARFRHFDVRARRRGDDFTDIATLLQVSTRELRIDGVAVRPQDATAALARRFTLAPIFDFTPKVTVELGDAGLAAWKQAMMTAKWPQYSVAVWRAGFKVAPFDKTYTTQLAPVLERYEGLLDGVASASILYEIRAMRQAIAGGVDNDGNGPAWSPVAPLSQVRTEIRGYVGHGERLKILDSLKALLIAARDQAPTDVQPLLAESSARIKALTADQRRARARLADVASEIEAEQEALDQITAAYKTRETQLQEHARDLERGAQSRQQLVSGIATAVSIVATAYTGSPQAGALAGGVVIAIGASGDGKKPVESLSAGYAFYDALRGPLDTSKKALQELDSTRNRYNEFIDSLQIGNVRIREYIEVPDPNSPGGVLRITHEQALSDLGAKGNAVWSGASSLIKTYQDFSAPPAKVPPSIEEDHDLKQLASEITTHLEKVKALILELEALQRTSSVHDRRLVEEAERSAELATLNVTNEEERRAVLGLVISLVRDELARLADTVILARRLSLVEYREDLPVDPEEIRRMFVAREISDQFDPTRVLTETAVLDQYIGLVERTRVYLELLATRVDNAMGAQFRSFVARRGVGPALSYPSHTFRTTLLHKSPDDQFVRDINRLLREQFEARGDEERWRLLTQQRIPVPFDVRNRVSGDYPLRFVQGAVTNARGVWMSSASDVTFTLELSRVGNFRHTAIAYDEGKVMANTAGLSCGCRADEDCYAIDFRSKESRPDQYFWWRDLTLADVRGGQTLLRTPDLSFWFLDPSEPVQAGGRTTAVSYPAAEAELFLRVRLDPGVPRAKSPKLTALTIKLEVFQ